MAGEGEQRRDRLAEPLGDDAGGARPASGSGRSTVAAGSSCSSVISSSSSCCSPVGWCRRPGPGPPPGAAPGRPASAGRGVHYWTSSTASSSGAVALRLTTSQYSPCRTAKEPSPASPVTRSKTPPAGRGPGEQQLRRSAVVGSGSKSWRTAPKPKVLPSWLPARSAPGPSAPRQPPCLGQQPSLADARRALDQQSGAALPPSRPELSAPRRARGRGRQVVPHRRRHRPRADRAAGARGQGTCRAGDWSSTWLSSSRRAGPGSAARRPGSRRRRASASACRCARYSASASSRHRSSRSSSSAPRLQVGDQHRRLAQLSRAANSRSGPRCEVRSAGPISASAQSSSRSQRAAPPEPERLEEPAIRAVGLRPGLLGRSELPRVDRLRGRRTA